MTDDIVTRNAMLPADFGDSLMKGIEETRSTISTGGGKPLLRLLKTGIWVFGQGNDDVQEGSRWAVNLASLARGWVCWYDGEMLGQVMSSIQSPQPQRPAPVDGQHEYKEQYSMELTCIDGDDAGTEVLYKNNSLGFKNAFEALISTVRDRYAREKAFYWPVIELREDSYDHKKHGQTFYPVLPVVAWANAEGAIAGQTPAVAKPAAPAPVATRVRKPPLQATEPAQEPVSTQQAHIGQRRRPAAR